MSFVDNIQKIVWRFSRRTLSERCWAVANLPNTRHFVGRDGGFMTFYEIKGAMRLLPDRALPDFTKELMRALGGAAKADGRLLTFFIERSPDLADTMLAEMDANIKGAVERLGLNTYVPDARRKHLNNKLLARRIVLCVTTTKNALNLNELNSELDALATKTKDLASLLPEMDPSRALKRLLDLHESYIASIEKALSSVAIIRRMSAGEAMQVAGHMIHRSRKPRQYQLLADKYAIRHNPVNSAAGLTAPDIASQLFRTSLNAIDNGTLVQCDDVIHAPLVIQHPPMQHQRLGALLSKIPADVPVRIAVHIDTSSSGVSQTVSRIGSIARTFSVFGGDNRDIANSADYFMRELKQGNAGCRVGFSIDTWNTNIDNARKQRDAIASAVEAWGAANVHYERGDSIDTFLSTLPFFVEASRTLPKHPWLWRDLVQTLPVSLPSSPFATGDLVGRLPDGHPFPIKLGASEQNSFSTLIAAPSGSGKSVFAAALTRSIVLRGGTDDGKLPPVAVIDSGFTQTFLAEVIRSELPEDRKHEVMCVTPQNSADTAINPFDLPLGLRKPLSIQRDFLASLLLETLTPVGSKPEPRLDQFAASLIDAAYAYFADAGMTRYHAGIKVIDDAIAKHGIRVSPRTTFWSLVDAFFAAGDIHAATVAQAYAVPSVALLPRVIAQSSQFRTEWESATFYQQPALEFAAQSLTSIAKQYPGLSNTTRYFWRSARLRVLNLQQCAPGARDAQTAKQSALYYMAAWFALAGEYWLTPNTLPDDIPEQYYAYHQNALKALGNALKTIIVDEFHRTSGIHGIRHAVNIAQREGRAANVAPVIISQGLTPDFDEAMIEHAANIILLGMPQKAAAQERIAEILGISEAEIDELAQHLRGVHPDYGSSAAILAELKSGMCFQALHIPISPYDVWTVTTTKEDRTLLNHIAERTGDIKDAIRIVSATGKFSFKNEILAEAQRSGSIDSAAQKIAERFISENRA